MKTLALDLDGKNGLDTFISRKWIMKYLGLRLGETNKDGYFSKKRDLLPRFKPARFSASF